MTKDEVKFLMESGYSVNEIMSMQIPAAAPAPAPDPEPAPAPAPDPEPAPAPTPVSAADARVDALVTAVQQLTQMVQGGNIRNTQFGSPVPDRTVEDILGEIINPPTKNK